MMIYSVVDGIEQKSTALGNAPNFAARRAYLQQRSTYETLGAMAAESLMTMKAVLEAIVYASFIFLVPLAVLPFGVRILLSWVQTLLWLQMWAPLYAVLNFIMSMSARSKSIEMLSTSNPERNHHCFLHWADEPECGYVCHGRVFGHEYSLLSDSSC